MCALGILFSAEVISIRASEIVGDMSESERTSAEESAQSKGFQYPTKKFPNLC